MLKKRNIKFFGGISLIFLLISMSSCTKIYEMIFQQRPDNELFKYYTEHPATITNSKLQLEKLYFDTLNGNAYLSFKSDGFVSYLGSTAMVPDTVLAWNFMNPERKRNGQPKDKLSDFGYFVTSDDSLKFTIHCLGALGAESIFEYKGLIYPDSLVLNCVKLPVYEHETLYDCGVLTFHVFEK